MRSTVKNISYLKWDQINRTLSSLSMRHRTVLLLHRFKQSRRWSNSIYILQKRSTLNSNQRWLTHILKKNTKKGKETWENSMDPKRPARKKRDHERKRSGNSNLGLQPPLPFIYGFFKFSRTFCLFATVFGLWDWRNGNSGSSSSIQQWCIDL